MADKVELEAIINDIMSEEIKTEDVNEDQAETEAMIKNYLEKIKKDYHKKHEPQTTGNFILQKLKQSDITITKAQSTEFSSLSDYEWKYLYQHALHLYTVVDSMGLRVKLTTDKYLVEILNSISPELFQILRISNQAPKSNPSQSWNNKYEKAIKIVAHVTSALDMFAMWQDNRDQMIQAKILHVTAPAVNESMFDHKEYRNTEQKLPTVNHKHQNSHKNWVMIQSIQFYHKLTQYRTNVQKRAPCVGSSVYASNRYGLAMQYEILTKPYITSLAALSNNLNNVMHNTPLHYNFLSKKQICNLPARFHVDVKHISTGKWFQCQVQNTKYPKITFRTCAPNNGNTYQDFTLDIRQIFNQKTQAQNQIATAYTITCRPPHRLTHISIKDKVSVRCNGLHLWCNARVVDIDKEGCQIEILYNENKKDKRYWVLRDDINEVDIASVYDAQHSPLVHIIGVYSNIFPYHEFISVETIIPLMHINNLGRRNNKESIIAEYDKFTNAFHNNEIVTASDKSPKYFLLISSAKCFKITYHKSNKNNELGACKTRKVLMNKSDTEIIQILHRFVLI